MIDLHTHSSASDGALTPTALIDRAITEGLSALALTDHDSFDGLDEAQAAADAGGLRFIRGIEIEIAFEPGEFHLLGLDFSAIQEPFHEAALALARSREDRNRAVLELFRADGVQLDYDELRERVGLGMIGRPHIAELLVSKRVVKSKQEAFDKYLAKGRSHYLRKACMELKDAIDMVHGSGGLAFIAHPMSLFVSWTKMRTLFGAWKEFGIDGIEAWHPTARLVECERLDRMAREFGYRISAGSDFHGANRPDRSLGHTTGNRPIGDEFLACLDRSLSAPAP
ncbi:MAG TPA: PHP domain-containing protein [bacterium]|nr:PHP domain-containing protein [bacterium]